MWALQGICRFSLGIGMLEMCRANCGMATRSPSPGSIADVQESKTHTQGSSALPVPVSAGATGGSFTNSGGPATLIAQRNWELICFPTPPLLLAFVGASLVLALTQGPAVVYIVARTLAQGRACGLASVLGVALGKLANAGGAALGLAALFAVSSVAFTVVKWAGAAYLVYLGIRMWRAVQAPLKPLRRVFRDGFVVALLNPKTTLFFAAFLPQFMDAHASPLMQTLALGGVFIGIACCTDLMYVLTANLVAPRLNRAAQHAGQPARGYVLHHFGCPGAKPLPRRRWRPQCKSGWA